MLHFKTKLNKDEFSLGLVKDFWTLTYCYMLSHWVVQFSITVRSNVVFEIYIIYKVNILLNLYNTDNKQINNQRTNTIKKPRIDFSRFKKNRFSEI